MKDHHRPDCWAGCALPRRMVMMTSPTVQMPCLSKGRRLYRAVFVSQLSLSMTLTEDT